MSGALLVAIVPLLAAALLCFVPVRAGAWVGLGAAVIAFALACRLAVVAPEGDVDALGTALALLAAFVGVTTAWFAAGDAGPEAWRARAANALLQAVLGGALLATLADDLVLGWAGLALGTVAMAGASALPGTGAATEAGSRCVAVCGAALALALFGIVVLGAAAPEMSWAALARLAPGAPPALLNLAFCILVAGWGSLAALLPLHNWLPGVQAEGGVAVCGILPALLLNAALANLLRLRGVMAACPDALAPGGALVVLGLLSVLGGALLLWRERETRRFLAMSTVGQGGLVAVAFGLGGPAVFAGLLHIVLHTLAKAALWQGIGRMPTQGRLWRSGRATAWLVLAAAIGVAGLPLGGVFASEFLVLAEAMRAAPGVALIAGLGVIIGAWAVLARLQSLLLGPAAPGIAPRSRQGALLGAWLNLALALVLGLAMPGPVVALLRAAAQGVRG